MSVAAPRNRRVRSKNHDKSHLIPFSDASTPAKKVVEDLSTNNVSMAAPPPLSAATGGTQRSTIPQTGPIAANRSKGVGNRGSNINTSKRSARANERTKRYHQAKWQKKAIEQLTRDYSPSLTGYWRTADGLTDLDIANDADEEGWVDEPTNETDERLLHTDLGSGNEISEVIRSRSDEMDVEYDADEGGIVEASANNVGGWAQSIKMDQEDDHRLGSYQPLTSNKNMGLKLEILHLQEDDKFALHQQLRINEYACDELGSIDYTKPPSTMAGGGLFVVHPTSFPSTELAKSWRE